MNNQAVLVEDRDLKSDFSTSNTGLDLSIPSSPTAPRNLSQAGPFYAITGWVRSSPSAGLACRSDACAPHCHNASLTVNGGLEANIQ
jgi:hypothetical protein